uniref:Serine protease n=1 Tax=Cryptotermes secundus sobeli-like virus 2 TaxID=3133511 RepID=A0AAT9JFS8_9VIRU
MIWFLLCELFEMMTLPFSDFPLGLDSLTFFPPPPPPPPTLSDLFLAALSDWSPFAIMSTVLAPLFRVLELARLAVGTTVLITLLVLFGPLLLYLVSRVCKLVYSFLLFLFHGATWWVRVFKYITPVRPVFSVEAMMPGSEFIDLRPPSSQFAFKLGSSLIGHGFRLDDKLVAPSHVASLRGLHIHVEGCPYAFDADALPWEQIDTDVSVSPWPSNMPISAVKVAPANETLTSVAACTRMAGSLGTITRAAFDLVKYNGSTRKGFSGALYMQRGFGVAMHVGGTSSSNVGIPLEYIVFLLNSRKESSDYYFLRQAMRGDEDLDYRPTGEPGVYEVYHRGKYYRVDEDDVVQLRSRGRRNREEDNPYEMDLRGSELARAAFESADIPTQPAVDPLREFVPVGTPEAQSAPVTPVVKSENSKRPTSGSGSPRVNPTSRPTQTTTPTTPTRSETSPRTTHGLTVIPERFDGPSTSTHPCPTVPKNADMRQVNKSLELFVQTLRGAIKSGTQTPNLAQKLDSMLRSYGLSTPSTVTPVLASETSPGQVPLASP